MDSESVHDTIPSPPPSIISSYPPETSLSCYDVLDTIIKNPIPEFHIEDDDNEYSYQ